MKSLRLALALVAVALLVLGVAGPAKACSCAGGMTEQQHIDSADIAFEGTPTAETTATTVPNVPQMSPRKTYRFTVSKTVKGSPSNPIDIGTAGDGAACGTTFVVGTPYRVYARRNDNGGYDTGLCSGNVEVSALPTTTTAPKPKPSTTTTTDPLPTTSLEVTTTTTVDDTDVTVAIQSTGKDDGNNVPLLVGIGLVAGAGAGAAGIAIRRRRA